MSFHSIPEILADIAAGRMVVILDDEDRENEGDLIMAASKVRPEDINFMARHARGLVCLTLEQERCRQLGLPLMVTANRSGHGTNFNPSRLFPRGHAQTDGIARRHRDGGRSRHAAAARMRHNQKGSHAEPYARWT